MAIVQSPTQCGSPGAEVGKQHQGIVLSAGARRRERVEREVTHLHAVRRAALPSPATLQAQLYGRGLSEAAPGVSEPTRFRLVLTRLARLRSVRRRMPRVNNACEEVPRFGPRGGVRAGGFGV